MTKVYRECKQCTKEFYITERDQKYFLGQNLELPKRCWTCRKANKKEARQSIDSQKQLDSDTYCDGDGILHYFVEDKRI